MPNWGWDGDILEFTRKISGTIPEFPQNHLSSIRSSGIVCRKEFLAYLVIHRIKTSVVQKETGRFKYL